MRIVIDEMEDIAMAFEKRFEACEKLQGERLFAEKLKEDIVNGEVFPSVRKGRIDFYHKGGKLFSYDPTKGFTTHHKYASVIECDPKQPYIQDHEPKVVLSFFDGYSRIKENCSLYSGDEAIGVSLISSRFSCVKNTKLPQYVVLDVEISLAQDIGDEEPTRGDHGKSNRTKSDRIDLVLLDTKDKHLRFFEAKDFSNSEIRAKEEPKIISQIKRYRKQLSDPNRCKEILAAYKNHVRVLNALFPRDEIIPDPLSIDVEPKLLIFNFDAAQLTSKLKNEKERLQKEFSMSVYAIGDTKKALIDTIWKGGKSGW